MRTKKIRWVVVVLLLIGLSFFVNYILELFKMVHGIVPHAYHVGSAISLYIEENGQLPESKDKLLEAGYLIIKEKDGKKFFYWDSNPCEAKNKVLESLSFFEQFEIKYGTDFSILEKRNQHLYYKGSDELAYLVTGPAFERLEYIYQEISLFWYQVFLEYKEKTGKRNDGWSG